MDEWEHKEVRLPPIREVLPQVEEYLGIRRKAGFLYFDIVQFEQLSGQIGKEAARELLGVVHTAMVRQRGRLMREEDIVATGGPNGEYFIIFLFSPPRKKMEFSSGDLKMIRSRITQSLQDLLHERLKELGFTIRPHLRSGYTVLRFDDQVPIERLVYEARKEATLKTNLEEVMGTFVANVSHELRTPLTCIKGYAETLLEGAHEEPELCKRFLGVIVDEARRLERLIKDLLDASMLDSRSLEMRFQEVELPALLAHTIASIQPHADKAKVELCLKEVPQDFPKWRADADRLSQVLFILVDNAIKFSEKGKRVTVGLERSHDHAFLMVQDEGTGIPAEEIERIFERFYKIEKGSTARFEGRGLGLPIARNIVEAHGGELIVESVLGEGSVFTISLPAGDPLGE